MTFDINKATAEQMKARIAELEAIANKKAAAPSLTIKTSETGSGVVSVYGLGRFPVSLHPEQWLRLLEKAEAIRKHVNDGLADGTLHRKADKPAAAPASK